jgi:hypothetical protein
MAGNWSDADNLVQSWDKIVGKPGEALLKPPSNPYETQVEDETVPQSSEDVNLQTAFILLASHGLESNIGKMMAAYAERTLPYTIDQLFRAYTSSVEADDLRSQSFSRNIRGMVILAYAWSYVMARTQGLTVRDRMIYPALANLSMTAADTEERKILTASAENKLEATLGLLLQARHDATSNNRPEMVAFFDGCLQILYALANLHYGTQASYLGDAT